MSVAFLCYASATFVCVCVCAWEGLPFGWGLSLFLHALHPLLLLLNPQPAAGNVAACCWLAAAATRWEKLFSIVSVSRSWQMHSFLFIFWFLCLASPLILSISLSLSLSLSLVCVFWSKQETGGNELLPPCHPYTIYHQRATTATAISTHRPTTCRTTHLHPHIVSCMSFLRLMSRAQRKLLTFGWARR